MNEPCWATRNPCGSEFSTPTGTSSLFGFTGEPTDATGLVHLRARYLDTAIGRFLSADSLLPNGPGTQGYNLYSYAGNDPTTWTDPTGHMWEVGEFVRLVLFAMAAILVALLVRVGWLFYQAVIEAQGSTGPVTQQPPEEPTEAPTEFPARPEDLILTLKAREKYRDLPLCRESDRPKGWWTLPPTAVVVRGGLSKAENFVGGAECQDAEGGLGGVSVNSYPGLTPEDLASFGINNKQYTWTTVADVRAAGGDVFPDPKLGDDDWNPFHALMFGLTPVVAAQVFLRNGRHFTPPSSPALFA